MAGKCKHPERVIGIHFFNPAPLMKLDEIIPAVQTKKKCLKKPGKPLMIGVKLPFKPRDTPGFIVNRVARPFYGEAIRILEEGLADVQPLIGP
ncbi:MAG: 3-hydroxyacyl-CoA dehydrogenase NAD-binding domain-containing protein [Saprospiraceae bacterium]